MSNSTSYPAYVYQTNDSAIVIVVPTNSETDVYAAKTPRFLSASDFNLTSVANSKTLREMRDAAREAGVRLKGNTCAHVADHSRINALEP